MNTINPKRLALLEKYGFFRFFDRDDLSIAEFANSECTTLEWWGLDIELVIKELGLLLAEWSAIVNFRSQLWGEYGDPHQMALGVFSERISGITFFGKYDPDFDRTELREVLYYVIYGKPWLHSNVCLFDYWIESCQRALAMLEDGQARHYLVQLRVLESKFHPIDGYSKYPRIGLQFWQRAIDLASHKSAGSHGQPATVEHLVARVPRQKPLGDIYDYLRGLNVEKFKQQLYLHGILSSSYHFIPKKNTFHKLTHILALPYILQHHKVIDSSFFECTQLERVDIYATSFSVEFGRNMLSDLAITDFMVQLEKKNRNDIAWDFYNEVTESIEASRINI